MNRYEETLNIDDIDIRRNISDFAGMIEAEYIKKIDRVITGIEERTTAEVAVVTLRKYLPGAKERRSAIYQ